MSKNKPPLEFRGYQGCPPGDRAVAIVKGFFSTPEPYTISINLDCWRGPGRGVLAGGSGGSAPRNGSVDLYFLGDPSKK